MSSASMNVSRSDEVERTIDHMTSAIERARESREPFAHIRFDDLFPAGLYARMLDTMPRREHYRGMSGRATTDVRTKMDLFPEWIRLLPPESRAIWQVVGKALVSAPVRDAFMRRVAPGLARRFGEGYATVGMYPVPILTRDVAGYSIGVHPDTRWKGITVQIYLPRDRSIEHVGTVFHEKAGDGYRASVRMPFWPNSGYAFAVGEDTYHSVDPIGPEVRTRDSIILTYFVDRTPLEIAQNRWKRFGNYLLAGARGAARLVRAAR
jgi:hypothetical protein